MKPSRVAALSIVLFLATILAFGQKVTTDWNHTTNFYKYKTFMWIQEPETRDPLMKQRVIDVINAQLSAKGLQLVTGGADLGVAANVATQAKNSLNTFYDGTGWGWGMGTATTTVDTYEAGTLIVDLFDAKTRKVVWRGAATTTVPDSPEKATKKLDKTVQKMFKKYPPM